jgi:putative hydrolase of the HAD superfamily
MRFAELDAVTVDGYGTLLRLSDPVTHLQAALAGHGIDRTADEVGAAFRAEVAHYRPRAHLGRDPESLSALRHECVGVFLAALGSPLEADSFVATFVDSLAYEAIPGAPEALEWLRAKELRLGVVANWDCALPAHLERLGLGGLLDTIVTSARAGVAKPDPAIFELALRELDVHPQRALHVGDESCDEEGAHAAGLAFRPAPLDRAFQGWE